MPSRRLFLAVSHQGAAASGRSSALNQLSVIRCEFSVH
ncbi:hypothetical protein C789_1734 [Microcystis aeruginosa FACHB-905 = DIANCHI905]|nr:hypothetical protein C789_1734 [Microcystis aeruginosa FACHB-905 = DIANCHI905]